MQKRQIRWRKDLLISVLEDSVLGLATVLVPMVPMAYPMVRMASQEAMPVMDLMELGRGLKVKVAQGQRGLPNLLDLVTDLDMEDMVLVMVDLVAMGSAMASMVLVFMVGTFGRDLLKNRLLVEAKLVLRGLQVLITALALDHTMVLATVVMALVAMVSMEDISGKGLLRILITMKTPVCEKSGLQVHTMDWDLVHTMDLGTD